MQQTMFRKIRKYTTTAVVVMVGVLEAPVVGTVVVVVGVDRFQMCCQLVNVKQRCYWVRRPMFFHT